MQKKYVKIVSIDEPIGRVICEDGSVHTFRIAIGAVYRMYNDDGQVMPHPEGGAAYGIANQVIINTVEEPNDVKLTDWREPVDNSERKKKAN